MPLTIGKIKPPNEVVSFSLVLKFSKYYIDLRGDYEKDMLSTVVDKITGQTGTYVANVNNVEEQSKNSNEDNDSE